MIQAIGAIGNENPYKDPEYIKIIQELGRLGVAPTGNKRVDKARLESEKLKLAQKINEKIQQAAPQEEQNDKVQRSKMEEERVGAMTVAELNKILHGLNVK